jgi:alkanesulfonate monooxygenase SsuD/methylene tetrahydromethanopterin reductase-like flavin-dependent oxidoreductase (luciferase family)
MSQVKLLLVLTENETLIEPRDLRGLVRMAVDAEAAGVDAVMMSEHVLLGPDSGASGVMTNPRDYAAPGNQPPSTAWPSSIVMLSAIAQATATLRLVAGAIIAPLRHPLLLAKELGSLDLLSEGRLVVLPTVSWSRDEYDALNVPFSERGKILDEQLEVLAKAWGAYPIRHDGPRFPFRDVWLEPGAYRPTGPVFWFGGQGMHLPLARRIAQYGTGLNPFGPLSDDDLELLAGVMREYGRDVNELEMVGGIRGTFHDTHDLADLDLALQDLPRQLAQGFTTICFKPAMFVADAAQVGDLCRDIVRKVESLTA